MDNKNQFLSSQLKPFSDIMTDARKKQEEINRVCEDRRFYQKVPINDMWLNNLRDTHRRLIENVTDAEQFVQKILSTNAFSYLSVIDNIEVVRRSVSWYIKWFKENKIKLNSFPIQFEESKYSRQSCVVQIDGRNVTPEFLRFFSYISLADQYLCLDTPALRVLELGSGYGGMARVVSLYKVGSKITLLDLPESLFCSYVYLKLNFPEKKVVFASSEKEIQDNLETSDFLLVPSVFAQSLEGQYYDIFINTQSLGEMSNETILYWSNFIQKTVKIKSVFLFNRFLNDCHVESQRIKENLGSLFLDDQWYIRYWHYDPPFARCPYIETHTPISLCIIAIRELNKLDVTKKKDISLRSLKLFQEVFYEDWVQVRIDPARAAFPSNRIYGVHAFDGSMDGALFKLWESIRLFPTKCNIFLMLRYLKTIRYGLTPASDFEETSYYKKLFEERKTDEQNWEGFDADKFDILIKQIKQWEEIVFTPRRRSKLNQAKIIFKKFWPRSIRRFIRAVLERFLAD